MTGIDFTSLYEEASSLDAAGTPRVVRERAVKVLVAETDREAVAVYRFESGRLVARTRSPWFEEFEAPIAVDPRESQLGAVLADGAVTRGTAPSEFGDAGAWCVAPLDDGALVVLASEEIDEHVEAATATVALHVDAALADVAAPPGATTNADDEPTVDVADTDEPTIDSETTDERGSNDSDSGGDTPGGVSGEVMLDALRYGFPDYAFVYDREGTYLDVLLGARNLSLNTPAQLIGNTVREVFDDEESVERIEAAIETTLSEWTTQTVEYAIQTPNGTLYYEGHLSPLPEDEIETEAVVMVARDVTERTERERELERQNERLEEFASVVSHDLRNPLEAASTFLQAARDRGEGDSAALDRVATSLDRMERIVADLLQLAREGEPARTLQPVAVGDLARATWDPLETAEATLDVASPPTVAADRDALQRALENLFRNAVEHGGDDVTVSVGALDDRGDDDTITGFYVADDGPGIPHDRREAVFETGYTTSHEGTGFGLPIVRRIAESHDWRVELTDSAAGGARFEFRDVAAADESSVDSGDGESPVDSGDDGS